MNPLTTDDDTREADIISRYQDRCKLELPLLVRSKLEEIIAHELNAISEKMKSQVLDIVRTSQEELFERVKDSLSIASHSSDSRSAKPDYFGSTPSTTHSSTSSVNLPFPDLDDVNNDVFEQGSKLGQDQGSAFNEDSMAIPTTLPIHTNPRALMSIQDNPNDYNDEALFTAFQHSDTTNQFNTKDLAPSSFGDTTNHSSSKTPSQPPFTQQHQQQQNISECIPQIHNSIQYNVGHETPFSQPTITYPLLLHDGTPAEFLEEYPHFDYFRMADLDHEPSV